MEVFKIQKNYSTSTVLSYLLLLISGFLIFINSDVTPWAILAFVLVAVNSIDKKEKLNQKELLSSRKKLDITFRIFLSVSIVLMIINNFFSELNPSFILYALILIPLTSMVILNTKE